MRVTFVCPKDSPAGGMRVIALYATRLAARGHEVTAVLTAQSRPSLSVGVRSFLKHGRWNPFSSRLNSYFADAPFTVLRLPHHGPVTDRDLPNADVVVATWWDTVEWASRLSASKGAKVHFMQDFEIWGGPRERVEAVYHIPMPRIVIAQWEVDLMRQRFGQDVLACVPNSVDTRQFHAPPRGKQQVPTVGLLYTTFRDKGCDVSLAAVNRARQELPELRVVAFGSHRPWNGLPLPDGTEFHFEAPDEELPSLYARCDAWLFGTRIEGFGLPLLEAMACRTPVIGTPAGAAPDLIGQGGGILVGQEDVEGMANGIVQIARMDESDWRNLSDQALRVATAYTWNDATDRFEDALRRACSGA